MRNIFKLVALAALVSILLLGVGAVPHNVSADEPVSFIRVRHPANGTNVFLDCDENSALCTEAADSVGYNGSYTGHDEPSLLFYDSHAGSGNSNVYLLTLPKDAPTKPTQNGNGGVWNFQLHPAFWLGMAMCDTQSDPNFNNATCTPDSDTNIFDNTSNPSAPDYIGKHPGTAFMEMQFYPPGWVNGCDAKKWCAALNIDSLSDDGATGDPNNADCIDKTGEEYVNFAFITLNGKSQAPADPLRATNATYTPSAKDLFMNPGDELKVDMHDTTNGFKVTVNDLTTGQTGSMTASIANKFGHPKWDPTGSICTDLPYAFHPMYATSSEHTRVTWTAHTYNVSFSDEIGHFEFCDKVNNHGDCTKKGANDPGGVDPDDTFCFKAPPPPFVSVSGCTETDNDFDGTSYGHTWPGSTTNQTKEQNMHPAPIRFTSPLYTNGGSKHNYERMGFEVDMPRIERPSDSPNNNCDKTTGSGCVNPPNGAAFYPIYSTFKIKRAGCWWQEGGAHIPDIVNDFGGTSSTEYGSTPFLVHYEGFDRYNDFQKILSSNPCPAKGGS